MKQCIFFASLMLSALLLAGCSGHPGAGKWTVIDEGATVFSHIKIDFDGKAAIYPKDKQASIRNCYWQASSADEVSIQCGTSEHEEGKLFYSLEVTEPTLAVLKKDDQVLGTFRREP